MSDRLRILCAAKLHANQLERHLELLDLLPNVAELRVVRHTAIPERLPKVRNVAFGDSSWPLGMWRMYRHVQQALAEHQADWVVGFNPIPWGTVALAAAREQNAKVCLCVIGRDYLQLHEPWAGPFRAALRRADAVTVPGEHMLEGLVHLGVRRERLFVLPHSVDTRRFSPDGRTPSFDVISVGQLIRRKRMDVLVEATGRLVRSGVPLRVGILGKGPLEAALREQVKRENLDDHVSFLPYRDDVETVLRSSRIFALPSEWEGVPFALMEAMATGLVPIVTAVGGIQDWVEDGRNGFVLPRASTDALTAALRTLLVDAPDRLDQLRQTLLDERARLDLPAGEEVWARILAS